MREVVIGVVKLKLRRMDEDRMEVRVFVGEDEDHLQLSGQLVLSIGEYQRIACALGIGVKEMVQRTDNRIVGECYGCGGTGEFMVKNIPLRMMIEGEKEALGRKDELGDGEEDLVVVPDPMES